MPIPASHFTYFWQNVVYPRLGLGYAWGGSLSPTDFTIGTDCSGWVSASLEALMYGSAMNYIRQFWTGTFAGITPGMTGPFQGLACTKDLVCIDSPSAAPPDAAMIISIIQTGSDPNLAGDAHMICQVRGVVTEMGGGPNNLHTGSQPGSTEIDDPEFNQFLYLPGPVQLDAPDWTSPDVLSALSRSVAA